MEIKTILTSAKCPEEFDQRVNRAVSKGWELVMRSVLKPPHGGCDNTLYAELLKPDEKAPTPDPEEEHRRILLEPDIAYLVEIKRGESSRHDYVNSALPLGMLLLERLNGKVKKEVAGYVAIEELTGANEHHEEETDDEQ